MQTQQKSAPGHVMPNFYVCIRLDLRVRTHYFKHEFVHQEVHNLDKLEEFRI
jgi:hypothetical protein